MLRFHVSSVFNKLVHLQFFRKQMTAVLIALLDRAHSVFNCGKRRTPLNSLYIFSELFKIVCDFICNKRPHSNSLKMTLSWK